MVQSQQKQPVQGAHEVVVVDDAERGLADALESALEVRSVSDEQAALAALSRQRTACLVLSDRIETDVADLLTRIREHDRAVPVVVVAFDGSESLASEAITAGVSEYVAVDSDRSDLSTRIQSALDSCREQIRTGSLDGIDAAVEHAADAILVTDTSGSIEYVNPAFKELTGYSREEAIGRNPRILKSGKQGKAYYEQMWGTILDGDIWEETIVNETQSGEKYIAHQTVAPVLGSDGTIERFVGIQRDITRQRRLEEQLERSEITLSRLYDTTANSGRDLETKIETMLRIATRHLGYQVGYFTRIRDGEQHITAAAGEHDTIEAGKRDPLERTYCRKTIEEDDPVVIGDASVEGWEADPAFEEFGLRCYAGARVLVDDELYGTLCFGGEDPTDALILEAHRSTIQTLANWVGYEIEREQYSRKLEQQNERLEQFASAVSHDLRNPLNVAQSYVTLAREENARDGALAKAADAHRRMEEIIEDTLTLAREGELVEEPAPLSLRSLAERCWQHVETEAATLEVDAEATLRGDADKLQHVFENLFRNAVEHGGTDVTVRVGPMDGGFYVEDDGEGIDEDLSEQLFEFGYTTGSGSGFGLAIVETIARAHNWTVRVTDSDAGGARFEFETETTTEPCLVC